MVGKRFMAGLALAAIAGLGSLAVANPAGGAPTTSPGGDDPFEVGGAAADSFENAIAERIQLAQKSFQGAKREFLQGMRNGRALYLTIRLMDGQGKVEQVFVKVDGWKDDSIQCRLASQVRRLSGYRIGQSLTCSEGDMLDWTILNPDGSSEGNYIGKFVELWAAAPKAADPAPATTQAAPAPANAAAAPAPAATR